jgi:pimeloyl-ACP methyl ester carboxylesterase
MSGIEGDLVAEMFDYDGGRQVTAYIPPDPPEAVIIAGDGQLIAQWGETLETADVLSTMIIGAYRSDDEMLRFREYSLAFDPEQFAAHEKFFVEDVRGWAASHFELALPIERTAVFGVSAGGELALAMGVRHPDVYGAIFCASPGAGYRPPRDTPRPVPRTYLVAGTLEPFFLENATRWATALREADVDVVMTERVGSQATRSGEKSYRLWWLEHLVRKASPLLAGRLFSFASLGEAPELSFRSSRSSTYDRSWSIRAYT